MCILTDLLLTFCSLHLHFFLQQCVHGGPEQCPGRDDHAVSEQQPEPDGVSVHPEVGHGDQHQGVPDVPDPGVRRLGPRGRCSILLPGYLPD